MRDYLQGCHSFGTSERSLNAAFLVLILKNDGVEDFRYFRSINLVVCLNEVLA